MIATVKTANGDVEIFVSETAVLFDSTPAPSSKQVLTAITNDLKNDCLNQDCYNAYFENKKEIKGWKNE